ncbi:hypothetical protein V6N13_040386 [Hibiscus sabdariffa]
MYGTSDRRRKHEDWELLDRLKNRSNLPWLLGGDLNDILSYSEKDGRRRKPRKLAAAGIDPGKGSQKNGSVTSGKGLALRAGHGGPSPEPVDCRCTARAAPAARAGRRVPAGGWTGNDTFGGLPQATNSRLRTGTDKGNPTV